MKKDRVKLIVILMSAAVIGLVAIQFYWLAHVVEIEEIRFERNVTDALNEAANKLEGNEALEVVMETIDNDAHQQNIFTHSESSAGSNENDVTVIKKFGKGEDSAYTFKYIISDEDDSSDADTEIIADKEIKGKNIKVSLNSKVVWVNKKKLVDKAVNKIISFGKRKKINERINEREIDSVLTAVLHSKGIYTDYRFIVRNSKNKIIFHSKSNGKTVKYNFKVKLFPEEFFRNPNYLLLDFPHKKLYIVKSVGWLLLLSILLIGMIIAVFYKTIKMLLNQKKITEVKNDLINNITHEFKTPISTISLACEALNEPELVSDKNDVNKYSSVIKEENGRLKLLVENLLNSAAIEKGNYKLNKENADINKLIIDSADKFRSKIAELNGTLKMNLEKNILPIQIDPFHIGNVFNNLLDNAVKYSNNKPEIIISSDSHKNSVQIVFEDNGCGIEKKYQNKIFETFYRVPTGNIHDVKGHGIGLSYAKQMIEAHGGTILIESIKNKGSKFTIILPYV